MEERDRDLLKKLQLSHESFYNNQYDRDSQLLKLIKEKGCRSRSQNKGADQGIQIPLYVNVQGLREEDEGKRSRAG